MRSLKAELHRNFETFSSSFKKKYLKSYEEVEANKEDFFSSYQRFSSLEAWRAFILEQNIDNRSLKFFIEAQNDALLSHAFARIGSWRSALQSLRSAIENVLFCLYYKDHPIEYAL